MILSVNAHLGSNAAAPNVAAIPALFWNCWKRVLPEEYTNPACSNSGTELIHLYYLIHVLAGRRAKRMAANWTRVAVLVFVGSSRRITQPIEQAVFVEYVMALVVAAVSNVVSSNVVFQANFADFGRR